ncbi:MAG: M48 family metalloprotease [Gammaproteobacteria bacterium]|nr:M48 family metalloprotease [Gammaproteobacteria bacterium]
MNRIALKHWLYGMVCAVLLALSGCAVNPVTGKQDFVLLSEDEEIALGRRMHPQLLEQMPPYEDPALQAYVREVGERLAQVSHRSNLIYRFTVLDSSQVNAFATPGGYIYITRGLLAYLNSEAELAAVLGHEIGHVTARHSVRQHSASTATGLLAAVIGAASGVQGAGDLANIAGTAVVRGYGREHELESDRLGAEYLAKSDYDPRAMLAVIGVLKDQETYEIQRAREEGREPRSYHGLFATHPANDTRLQETVLAADRFLGQGGDRGDNRETFLRHLDGLTFGDGEQDGVLRGSRFYHKPMNFTLEFPAGWRVENQPAALVAQLPNDKGIMKVEVRDLNKRESPREFMQGLGIKEMRAEQSLTVAGLPGYTALVPGNTPQGEQWIRVAVLYYGDQVFIFSGFHEGEHAAVLSTVRSFRPLTEAEKVLAEAQRIKLIRADTNTRYDRLAARSPIQFHAEEQLRLLNGKYPSGQPVAGQLLKIVE